MNKNLTIALILLVIVLIILGGMFYYFQLNAPKPTIAPQNSNFQLTNVNNNINSNPVSNQNLNTTTVHIPVIITPVNNGNSNQPDFQPASIGIANFAFSPAQLTVKIGTTVTWTNNDPVPHQIAGSIFNSQPLNTGDIYSFTFTQAGSYPYHCAIHPSMTGQIIVAP